jgi:NTE family protein
VAAEVLTVDERREALTRLPLFGSVNPVELERVAMRFGEVSHRKGKVIWRQGDAPDSFLVVVRGELEILGGKDGRQVVNRLRSGECLGEMALLLEERRSATVIVSRSAVLLTLDKRGFQSVTAENPRILEYFLQVIAKRLAASAHGEVPDRQSLVVTVSGEPAAKGKTLVAAALAALLGNYLAGRVLTIRLGQPDDHESFRSSTPLREAAAEPEGQMIDRISWKPHSHYALPVTLPPDGEPSGLAAALDAVIARVTPRFSAVVIDACEDSRLDRETLAASSDVLVEVVGRNESLEQAGYPHTRVFQVLNMFSNGARPLPINASAPYVLPSDAGMAGRTREEVAARVLEVPMSPTAPSLQRLARKILGISVGIAMGGGAAFGIAHVGVLRTLEEHGIPIDLLAGTSFGSIVALGYAVGIRADEMEVIAARIGNKRTTLSALDFTPMRPGLLSGRRLKAIFSPALGSAESFEHLTLPCRTVATDIDTGERVMIGEGRLDDAFRASCSVPMLWSPVRRDGRTLVDGAIVDPVPASVAREMGADLCIAVNVVPTLKPGVTTVLSRASRAVNSLNPFSYLNDSREMPNIFDVVMNSMQVLQYELGNFRALSADVRLSVDLSSYTWIEFYRARELIERGAEAAEAIVPEIEQLVADRLPAADGADPLSLRAAPRAASEA